MRVVYKIEVDDEDREVIAGWIDELEQVYDGKKVRKRKATREEIRQFLEGAYILRIVGVREELEDALEMNPENFTRSYTVPRVRY
jgi:hypothetical protein